MALKVLRYRFIKKLGKGAYGVVWEVTSKDNNKTYACKIQIKKKFNAKTLKMLKAECNIMGKLRHKNVCELHAQFETKTRMYIVLEHLAGGDLYERLTHHGHFKESHVRSIIKQILEAVAYAHAKGIIHCDLKPENVLFETKKWDSVKIIDFGLSQSHSRMQWMTHVGGTPMYMAPEMLKKKYTDAVDLWAIGVMTFELLFGYLPFNSKTNNPLDFLKMAAKGFNAEERSGQGPWFPKGVRIAKEAKDLIKCLLELKPEDRLVAEEAQHHPWFSSTEDYNLEENVLKNVAHRKHDNGFKRFAKHLVEMDCLKGWMIEDIKKILKEYDANGNGTLDLEEFEKALHHLTHHEDALSHHDIQMLFENIDDDHSGEIDIEEFIRFYAFEFCSRQDDRVLKIIEKIPTENNLITANSITKFKNDHPELHIDDEIVDILKKKGPMNVHDFVTNII